jgi:hypothetical protein
LPPSAPRSLLTLFGVVLLAREPRPGCVARGSRAAPCRDGRFVALAALPAIATPLILAPFDTRFLPVLVADYLALHLALYGALTLGLRRGRALCRALQGWVWGLALAAYGLIAFGGNSGPLRRQFHARRGPYPDHGDHPARRGAGHAGRCGPAGGRARALWRRWTARLLFLASLGLAVALDFERLFFLLIILPVILLFYLSFGLMGAWVGKRTGR